MSPSFVLGIDYKYRDDYKKDTVSIELLTGQYSGVIFRYTNISVKEEGDKARLIFGFEIIHTGDRFKKKKALVKNKEFKEFLFHFLVHMFETVSGDFSEHENRTRNIEKSDPGPDLL